MGGGRGNEEEALVNGRRGRRSPFFLPSSIHRARQKNTIAADADTGGGNVHVALKRSSTLRPPHSIRVITYSTQGIDVVELFETDCSGSSRFMSVYVSKAGTHSPRTSVSKTYTSSRLATLPSPHLKRVRKTFHIRPFPPLFPADHMSVCNSEDRSVETFCFHRFPHPHLSPPLMRLIFSPRPSGPF